MHVSIWITWRRLSMTPLNLLIPEVTIEECAEVIQAITKYIRFGPSNSGYDNKLSLEKEIGQLEHMLYELKVHYDLDQNVISVAKYKKKSALLHYAMHNIVNQTEPKAQ
jgi:hypothetical protein